MEIPKLAIPNFISLKGHPTLDERWLHDRLIEHPELLQIGGELNVRESERRQPSGGRLDLLLEDSESQTRYEVEIQLGAVDESHIIRTIEYWDIERRRFPQYDHIAVIVAEDVTSRFLNVISLFNRTIPLLAIQIRGVEVKGAFTLVATRVIDVVPLGTEDEDSPETVDRTYWEQKVSTESLRVVDGMLALIAEIDPSIEPKYNKHYIGMLVGGSSNNFVEIKPQKKSVIVRFRLPQSENQTAKIEDAGLVRLRYDNTFGRYQVRLNRQDLTKRREILLDLVRTAYEMYAQPERQSFRLP